MMKKLVLIGMMLLVFMLSVRAQGKYFTRDGFISFFSHTAIEDISARNNKVASVLDMASGQLEFAVLMKAFEFKKALMQQHFNESYVESEKYPKAEFRGKILNIGSVDLTRDGTYPVQVEGALTIKGVTKPLQTNASLMVKGGLPQGIAEFKLKPADYNIEIPSLVRANIAEEILVKVDIPYQPLNK